MCVCVCVCVCSLTFMCSKGTQSCSSPHTDALDEMQRSVLHEKLLLIVSSRALACDWSPVSSCALLFVYNDCIVDH